MFYFFSLPDKGILEMGSLPSTNTRLRTAPIAFFIPPIFVPFNEISIKRNQSLILAAKEVHYSVHQKWRIGQQWPNKSPELCRVKCHGSKFSKTSISVLLAANMNGTSKLRHFVIGKSASPIRLKNCSSRHVRYANNRESWMVGDLFYKWLNVWGYELECSSHKV